MIRQQKTAEKRKTDLNLDPSTSPQKKEPAQGARKLTEAQDRFAELVGDMLVNGGDREDIILLIHAALRHQLRRMFPDETTLQQAKECAWRSQERDYTELARDWSTKRKTADYPDPTTVKEMIAADIRRRCRSSMDSFLERAEGTVDLYIMHDVLSSWESGHNELGEAFFQNLATNDSYVRVYWKHEKKVKHFAEMLKES